MIRKVKSYNNVRCNSLQVDIGYIAPITPITQQIECSSQYNINTKEYISCAMAPMLEAENEATLQNILTKTQRNYWYEMSEYCNNIKERYINTLLRVRKRRKSATF